MLDDNSRNVELPSPLPPAWSELLAHSLWHRETIGASDANVFRLEQHDRALFLKLEPASAFSELPAEVARLEWLARQGQLCPRVLHTATEYNSHWLLMSAVLGRDLEASDDLTPEQIVTIAAKALRQLHSIAVETCPFDHRLNQRIEHVRARVAAGLVDQTDFDETRLGKSAEELFAELLKQRPQHEDLVVTHGDACLPNLLADSGAFSGFIDCGRLGVADRYQDLALAARSIESHLGAQWTTCFFERYGVEPQLSRIEFYQLLDEFF